LPAGARVLTSTRGWFPSAATLLRDPRRWDLRARLETTLAAVFAMLGGAAINYRLLLGWVARRYRTWCGRRPAGDTNRRPEDVHRRVDEMTAAEFASDLARAGVDRFRVGRPADAYRAAEWSIRDAGSPALRELARAGFRCDASTMPVPPLGRVGNPTGPHRIQSDGWELTELPPLTGRAFGRRLPLGGAWPFRLLSERRLEAEDAVRDRGEPAIFTIHPWEFDPAIPPWRASRR
jgi:hypothetical protein